MRYLLLGVVTVVCGPLPVNDTRLLAQGKNDPNKGWIEVDDLMQANRISERPGNYRVVAAIAEFFERTYAIRPDYSQCAYPLQLDSQTIESHEAHQKLLDAQTADGNRPSNKNRQYNVQIRNICLYEAHSLADPKIVQELQQASKKTFTKAKFDIVRKRHPGRAIVAIIRVDWESLQSPKVEDGHCTMFLVESQAQWKVAWFDK